MRSRIRPQTTSRYPVFTIIVYWSQFAFQDHLVLENCAKRAFVLEVINWRAPRGVHRLAKDGCRPIVGWIRSLFESRALWVAAAALAFCGGGVAWWSMTVLGDPAREAVPFRIGFQRSPPYQEIDGAGAPMGPAIEIVAEACRRRGLRIEWVHSPEGPEASLRAGKVDLWPLLGDLPERRKFLYISGPWMTI